jgi:hypothetical protein
LKNELQNNIKIDFWKNKITIRCTYGKSVKALFILSQNLYLSLCFNMNSNNKIRQEQNPCRQQVTLKGFSRLTQNTTSCKEPHRFHG